MFIIVSPPREVSWHHQSNLIFRFEGIERLSMTHSSVSAPFNSLWSLFRWILLFESIDFYEIGFWVFNGIFTFPAVPEFCWRGTSFELHNSTFGSLMFQRLQLLNLISQAYGRRCAITQCLQLFKLIPLQSRITSNSRTRHVEISTIDS